MVALLHQGHAPERERGQFSARADGRQRGHRAPLSPPPGSRAHLRLVVDRVAVPDRPEGERAHRPALRSVEPASAGLSVGGVSVVAVVVAGVLVFGLLGAIRVVQAVGASSPAAAGGVSSSVGVGGASSASVEAIDQEVGDRLVVVGPGDSLWSIASELAPGQDPRPVVEALAEVNGGTSLQIGQQIVIPRGLLE